MKIAFVIQRCGLETGGGSELHCLQVADHVGRFHETEILTTCALEYTTWANHYPEGGQSVGNTTIRRFPVDRPRDVQAFNRLSESIRPRLAELALEEQEEWMRAQGPMSKGLEAFIREHADDYDLFVFFTYLYATSYFLMPLVADKAVLVPTAHDEWPIYMSMFDRVFTLPKGLVFNTRSEKAFIGQRFPKAPMHGPEVGVGIEIPEETHPAAFREQTGIIDPFLLYVGRIDPSKGCGELFDHFQRLKGQGGYSGKLVLAGKPVMEIPEHPDIVPLGFVEEQTKWDALAACDWLVNPSPHESLSIVMLEAFGAKRPVLVNGRCHVLVDQCVQSNGGLWYDSFEEFAYIVSKVDQGLKSRLGQSGRRFVEERYTWDVITGKLCNFFEELKQIPE